MIDVAQRYWWIILLVALAVFLIVQPSYVGWWVLERSPDLGAPLWETRFWALYGPDAAMRWWLTWSGDEAFMQVMRDGAKHGLVWASLAAVFTAYVVRVNAPLPHVEAEEQPDRFGTARDLLESPRFSLIRPGVVVGRDGRHVLWHVGDDHCLVVGTSRLAEKTSAFVKPTIVDADCSLVVLDVKGELAAATADWRRRAGPVWIVNPTAISSQACYNPMLEIRRDDHCITDCRSLAQLVTADASGSDPFWATKAADLLAGVFRVVVLEAEAAGPKSGVRGFPTLSRARKLLLEIGARRAPKMADTFAREMIESHLALEDRPRSGVDAQAQMALSFASDPAVVNATTRSHFTAGDLVAGERPATVYLTMEVSSFEALHMYSRVVLQSLLLGLLHDRDETIDGRRKRHKIMFVIDEFPALGSLPFFEHAMATMAGRGIKAVLVCQSISQIVKAYGNDQAIAGNCGTQILVPPFDDMTMRHATARCGTMIAKLRARHRRIAWIEHPSETTSQSRHPRANAADVQMQGDTALILPPAGLQPCWVRRNRWWENPRYKERIRAG